MTKSLGGSVCLASVHSQNLGYLAIYRDEQLLNLTVALKKATKTVSILCN
jgi:hypothetical protein